MLGVTGVHHYVFTGPAGKLPVRGYAQKKLVSLFDDVSRRMRATAVVVASVGVGLLRLPLVLFGSDGSVDGVVVAVVLSTVSGVVLASR